MTLGLVRAIRHWFEILTITIKRRPLIAAPAAFACTMAGAFLLAYFTRRTQTEAGLLEGSPVIAALSIILLLFGVAVGSMLLWNEFNSVENEPVVERPKPTARTTVLGVAILVAAIASVTMGQMGELLSGFHRPGEASLAQGAIQSAGIPWHRNDKIDEALTVWSRFARPALHPDPAAGVVGRPVDLAFPKDADAPITVLTWFFGLDAGLFVPGYFAVLGLLLVLAARTLRQRARSIKLSANAPPTMYAQMARRGAAFLMMAAFSDQIENWTGLSLTASAWFAGSSNVSTMRVSSTFATLLGLASLAKTIFLGLTFICLLLVGIHLLRHGSKSDQAWTGTHGAWHSVLAVRIQVIAVALFAVLMSLRIQAADTFLRWVDDWWVAVLASVLVVLLGAAVWHTARWLTSLAIITYASGASPDGRRMLAGWLAGSGATLALIVFGVGAGWAPSVEIIIIAACLAAVIYFPLRWAAKGAPVKAPTPPDWERGFYRGCSGPACSPLSGLRSSRPLAASSSTTGFGGTGSGTS